MNFNFFDWLRAGVKQSVILGVADAVDHLGTPRKGDDVSQRLLSFLHEPGTVPVQPRLATGPRPQQRKLGRTMKDIQASANAPAAASRDTGPGE